MGSRGERETSFMTTVYKETVALFIALEEWHVYEFLIVFR